MEIKLLMMIAIAAIFINNFVLTRFLGICPYIGVSKNLDSAIGMGFAVVFVMTLASTVTWLIDTYLLQPNELKGWFSNWDIIHYFEGIMDNPRRATAQIICKKGLSRNR